MENTCILRAPNNKKYGKPQQRCYPIVSPQGTLLVSFWECQLTQLTAGCVASDQHCLEEPPSPRNIEINKQTNWDFMWFLMIPVHLMSTITGAVNVNHHCNITSHQHNITIITDSQPQHAVTNFDPSDLWSWLLLLAWQLERLNPYHPLGYLSMGLVAIFSEISCFVGVDE